MTLNQQVEAWKATNSIAQVILQSSILICGILIVLDYFINIPTVVLIGLLIIWTGTLANITIQRVEDVS